MWVLKFILRDKTIACTNEEYYFRTEEEADEYLSYFNNPEDKEYYERIDKYYDASMEWFPKPVCL